MEMHHMPLLLLFIFFCWACERSSPSEVETGQLHPEVEQIREYDSEDFTADSMELLGLYNAYPGLLERQAYDSAIMNCRAAMELGKPMMAFRYDSSLYEIYARAHGALGYRLLKMGYLDEALDYSSQALEMYKEKFGENHVACTEAYVAVAYNYQFRGDYDRAIEYIHKSLHIMNQVFAGNHRYFGNNYNNLGNIYSRKGDYDRAIHYYGLAMENRKALGLSPAIYLDAYLNIAECFLKMGDLDAASKKMDEGMALAYGLPGFENLTNKVNLLRIRIALARKDFFSAYQILEEYLAAPANPEALHLQQADFGQVHYLAGTIERQLNRWQEAETNLHKAIEIWDKNHGKVIFPQIDAILELAALKMDQGDVRASLLQVRHALERILPDYAAGDLLETPELKEVSASQFLLQVMQVRIGVLMQAFQIYGEEKYLLAARASMLETIGYLENSREGFQGQDSKVALSQKAVPIVEAGLICAKALESLSGDETYLQEAFSLVERVKNIVLLENLHTSFAKNAAGIDRALQVREQQLLNELALYERLILEERQKGKGQDSAKLFYWHNKQVAAGEAYDSLMQVLKVRHPEFYRLQHNLPIAGMDAVQDHLGSDEVLINYFLGDSTLSIFTVSENGYSFHQQPWAMEEETLLHDFITYANNPSQGWTEDEAQKWAADGYRLFRLLLPGLEVLPSALIIIPDGKLGYLPFHLLPVQDPEYATFRDIPYLLQSCPIRYQFSASLLLQPFKPAKKATQPYAGFAPAYEGDELTASRSAEDSLQMAALYPEIARDGLSPLAFNQPEVEAAASLWEREGYVGAQATEQRFKEVAPDAEILHLAMHALTNDQEPLLSQLVFAESMDTTQDGKLHNYELQNLQLSAELTVLSACNTGAGQLRRGEGVMSVSRAFRLAGCPNIVMSLWQANDRSTAAIVTGFFEKIEKGEGKARALQTATLEFLKSADERYTHPFYWGNMMLVGDDEPVRRGWSWWWVMGALGVSLLMLAFVRWLGK